jgi:type I restriction enzyme, S subunit
MMPYFQVLQKKIPANSILFAMYGATIGKTCITTIEATTNQACCVIRPLHNNTIDTYFLQQYLILRRNLIISLGEGAGQPNTSQDFVRSFQVVYPPYKEQLKISSVLSRIDKLIQKIDQIIEQTQRLKKGLMQKLLTKGIGHTKFRRVSMGFKYMIEEYPEEWKISKLNELSRVERGKFTHRPRDDPNFYGGNYPFIQTGDIERSDGYKDFLSNFK